MFSPSRIRVSTVVFLCFIGGLLLHASPASANLLRSASMAHPGKVITIHNDLGGSVVAYALAVNQIRARGQAVRIAGRCESACTLLLSLPLSQVCVTASASFGFHAAHGASREMNIWGTKFMFRSYPSWVRNWIAANGGLDKRIKHMYMKNALQMLRRCDMGPKNTRLM